MSTSVLRLMGGHARRSVWRKGDEARSAINASGRLGKKIRPREFGAHLVEYAIDSGSVELHRHRRSATRDQSSIKTVYHTAQFAILDRAPVRSGVVPEVPFGKDD